MKFHQHQYANGLQLIGEVNPAALSTAIGFFVRTGARDEMPGESGVSHFLEHMVFKGTERRNSFDVNRDFDRIGADNNAYTSEESTVFFATVLPEYLPDAVDVLADILRPSLRKEDFDTEKQVILDEIARYDIQPAYACYERGKQIFFGEHLLGQSILGTRESITALTRDQMADYFGRRYSASNIVVSIAGNFNWSAAVGLIERHCGAWTGGPTGRRGRVEPRGTGGIHAIRREKVTQEYVECWAPAPPADSSLRHAGNILSSVVGDSSGSRLYWALVDPGLADSADMGYAEYDKAGVFLASLSCQPDDAAKNLAILQETLAEVQKHGITDEELTVARTRIASRIVRGSERTFRRMQGVAHDWIYLSKYHTLDEDLAAIDAVDQRAIGELLERYPLTNLTTVALGPLEKL